MSISTISVQSSNLALEALSVSDMQAALSKIFPKMVGNFKEFLNSFNPSIPGIDLSVNDKVFMAKLKDVPYLDIEGLVVTIPEGMLVSYPEYVATLAEAADYVKEVQDVVLNKISLYLAMLISDPQRKFDTLGLQRELDKRSVKRDALIAKMTSQTDAASTQVKNKIGNVVQRNSDWEKVFTEFRSVARKLNSIDRRALEKKKVEIVQYLETITAKLSRGEFEGVTSEVTTSLGGSVLTAAKELEFVGFVMYRAVGCGQAINTAVSDIERMLK